VTVIMPVAPPVAIITGVDVLFPDSPIFDEKIVIGGFGQRINYRYFGNNNWTFPANAPSGERALMGSMTSMQDFPDSPPELFYVLAGMGAGIVDASGMRTLANPIAIVATEFYMGESDGIQIIGHFETLAEAKLAGDIDVAWRRGGWDLTTVEVAAKLGLNSIAEMGRVPLVDLIPHMTRRDGAPS